jgi:hypothetical protein
MLQYYKKYQQYTIKKCIYELEILRASLGHHYQGTTENTVGDF